MRRSHITVVAAMVGIAACGPRLGAVPPPASVSAPICSPVPTFGQPIDAFYPSGVLQNQQGMVPVVGIDRLVPLWPAIEYFAGAGIANGSNIVSYAATQTSSSTAVVQICRGDGTVINAEMYWPFPSATRPIWAVRSYRMGR